MCCVVKAEDHEYVIAMILEHSGFTDLLVCQSLGGMHSRSALEQDHEDGCEFPSLPPPHRRRVEEAPLSALLYSYLCATIISGPTTQMTTTLAVELAP